jgi:hypothetical protein
MIDEDLENSPQVMLLEITYLDENDQLHDLKSNKEDHHDARFSMTVPDSINMEVYKKEETGKSRYELFAVLVLDPTCLGNCLQYAAVKKRTDQQ